MKKTNEKKGETMKERKNEIYDLRDVPEVRIQLIRDKQSMKKKIPVLTPKEIYESMEDVAFSDREQMVMLCLDNQNNIICKHLVSMGTINETLVSPREIFKVTLLTNSARFILVHNHPSGILEPSDADIGITRKIKDCGKMMDITLLDHIIISPEGYYSFHFNKKL